jgi:hypothetical protein
MVSNEFLALYISAFTIKVELVRVRPHPSSYLSPVKIGVSTSGPTPHAWAKYIIMSTKFICCPVATNWYLAGQLYITIRITF